MAWSETDQARVEKAIASGTLRVQYADRSVTYRSLSELRSVLREIKAALGVAAPARRRYAQTRTGLE